MIRNILLSIGALLIVVGGAVGINKGINHEPSTKNISQNEESGTIDNLSDLTKDTEVSTSSGGTSSSGTYLSQSDLQEMAGQKYADGEVPLGDDKYTTTSAKMGYAYVCNPLKGGGGAQTDGDWIHGSTWNYLNKITVDGKISWSQAFINITKTTTSRNIESNGLPTTHTTGIYPVSSSDDAYQIDRNPNTIKEQDLSYSLPKNPVYSNTPTCIGGEVGIMISGVPLFNSFDAEMRDAPAHEVQDSCDGHPQESGQYHYHGPSSCFGKAKTTELIGYAYDGFPITGSYVDDNNYLTSEDLDVCHGITSDVYVDGVLTKTYHYVMTVDFPYSIACYRGSEVYQVPHTQSTNNTNTLSNTSTPPQQSSSSTPPQEAITACSGKSTGSSCSFTTPNGSVSGYCQTPPGSSLACVPS